MRIENKIKTRKRFQIRGREEGNEKRLKTEKIYTL